MKQLKSKENKKKKKNLVFTLRNIMDGYREHNVSTNVEICLHRISDDDLKRTIEVPVVYKFQDLI